MRFVLVAMYFLVGLGAASAEYRDSGNLTYAHMAILLWPVAVGNQLWTQPPHLSSKGNKE